MSAKCVVCRRSSFMGERSAEIMCADCENDFTSKGPVDPFATPVDVALWAAKRAWEFADAITDATTFAHRPGDPGHSRTPRRPRRK